MGKEYAKSKNEIRRLLKLLQGRPQAEPVIMALEWVLNEGVSTSLDLESWIEEQLS